MTGITRTVVGQEAIDAELRDRIERLEARVRELEQQSPLHIPTIRLLDPVYVDPGWDITLRPEPVAYDLECAGHPKMPDVAPAADCCGMGDCDCIQGSFAGSVGTV